LEIEFFWEGKRIGASLVAPQILDLGAVVVVTVPHLLPSEDVVHNAFEARAPDGRKFTLDIVKVKPNTGGGTGPSSTVSGYLRPV
jgi:hypothetical protein